jgi:thiamine biosynthesis protein ThiI
MRGLLLLSGGIDSPVAGKLMIDKGYDVVGLHFSLEPFTDDTPEKKSKIIAKKIGIKKLLVIKHGDIQSELVKKCNHRYYYILQRRLMLRTAEKIAKKEKCSFLITGDSIGQVGSQTLTNLANITKSVKIEIARPLLGNDKEETITLAKKFGTYDISVGPEMCSVLGPKHPATSSKIEVIEREEAKLDYDKLVNEGLKRVKKNS